VLSHRPPHLLPVLGLLGVALTAVDVVLTLRELRG
jgi:hypothetical protein